MIVCSKCKKFIKNVTYTLNTFTDSISNVTGWCKQCHKRVPCDWDCYEDVAGWPKE
jgi:hypothetical protein